MANTTEAQAAAAAAAAASAAEAVYHAGYKGESAIAAAGKAAASAIIDGKTGAEAVAAGKAAAAHRSTDSRQCFGVRNRSCLGCCRYRGRCHRGEVSSSVRTPALLGLAGTVCGRLCAELLTLIPRAHSAREFLGGLARELDTPEGVRVGVEP